MQRAIGTMMQDKSAQGDASAGGMVLETLREKKRWIIVALAGLIAAGIIWYGFFRIGHPDAGPYDLTFKDKGGQLEMSIFWHCLSLPIEPDRDAQSQGETVQQIGGWSVALPNGKTVTPTWTATRFQHTVNVVFIVPRSTSIVLRNRAPDPPTIHEAEFETPASPSARGVVLKWRKPPET